MDSFTKEPFLFQSHQNNRILKSHFPPSTKGVGLSFSEPYFLEANKNLLTFGFAFNVTFFLFMKLLKLISKKIHRSKPESRVLHSIYVGLSYRTRKWVLLLMLLDYSFLRLSYSCFNQLANPVSFDAQTKANNVAAVTTLFMLVMYSSVSYLLLKRYHRNSAETLLAFSKETTQGFLLENTVYNFTRVVKAFAHSGIIGAHTLKLQLLIVTEILTIAFIIRLRKSFFNKVFFAVYLFYDLGFLVVNTFLLWKWTGVVQMRPSTYEKMIEAIILSLIALTILKVLLGVFKSIKECCQ